MSKNNIVDDLSQKQGGENPLFYTHLNLIWAQLGNLVTDSVCPKKQLELDGSKIPSLSYFIVSSSSDDFHDQYNTRKRWTISRRLSLASWTDSSKPPHPSSIPPDRRFAFINDFHWDEGDMRSYQKVYGHVGRFATSNFTASQSGISEINEGIPDSFVSDTMQLLNGEGSELALQNVRKLRADGTDRFDKLRKQIPNDEQIQNSHQRDITGLDGIIDNDNNSVLVDILVRRMRAIGKQQLSQLTCYDALYVPYISQFFSNYIKLIA